MNIDEYIAYCRSGQSTRDQRRRTEAGMANDPACGICEL